MRYILLFVLGASIGIVFGLAFLIMVGCDFPKGTTEPTTIRIDNSASVGTAATPSPSGGVAPPTEEVTVSYSSTNDAGKVIYSIGPGLAFSVQGGDAKIVWCRPASDCNGDGTNRTGESVASPLANWVVRGHAFFRQAGSTGSLSIFIVDGQEVRHNFE